MDNPYTEPGWEELLDSEWVSTETEIPDLIAAIRELHARLRTAKAEGAAEELERIYAGKGSSTKFYPEYLLRRATAIRKGIEAKEGK